MHLFTCAGCTGPEFTAKLTCFCNAQELSLSFYFAKTFNVSSTYTPLEFGERMHTATPKQPGKKYKNE